MIFMLIWSVFFTPVSKYVIISVVDFEIKRKNYFNEKKSLDLDKIFKDTNFVKSVH